MNTFPKSSSSKNEQKDQPRDFELIELLFRDKVPIRSDISSNPRSSAQLEDFVTRFQSFIDQIPSYLHSVEKPGFFTHYWFGAFSTVLDTSLNAEKIGIKKLHFHFDDARTLKIVAETEQNTHVFIFNEDISKKDLKFTKNEWRSILGRDPTSSEVDKLKIDVINITKESKAIRVQRESKKIYQDFTSTTVQNNHFQEIKSQLKQKNKAGKPIYLEGYIHEFSNPIGQEVRDNLNIFLDHITKVHNGYPDIPYGSEEYNIGRKKHTKTLREANHHGFLTGALMNYKYRYNAKIYPEKISGSGQADIVALFRGPNRISNAVPIFLELKAGDITSHTAFTQTDKYTPGLKNLLTNSNQGIRVGVNFDSPTNTISEVFDIKQTKRLMFENILNDINAWRREELTEGGLRERVKASFSHEYNAFPGTKESTSQHYFTRYIVGQSILVDINGENNLKKYLFSYSESPLKDERTRDVKAPGPPITLENNPVTTLVFIQGNNLQDQTAFIFHIQEDSTKNFSDKKIPITSIKGTEKVNNVVEMHVSLMHDPKDQSFDNVFSIDKVDKYKLNNHDNSQKLSGSFIEITHSDTIKSAFDNAIDSQRQSDIGSNAYKNLLSEKVAKIIFPIKRFIKNEAEFQGFLNGLYSSYRDLKLKESVNLGNPNQKVIVAPEFQIGGGGRADMITQAIGPSDKGTKEYTPLLSELKVDRKRTKELSSTDLEKKVETLTKDQKHRYKKGAGVKTITDSNSVGVMGIMYNPNARTYQNLIITTPITTAEVVHSSITEHKHKINLRECFHNRGKRSIGSTGCSISWDEDIKKFNAETKDPRNYDKIKIDSEKFFEHLSSIEDSQKKAELMQLLDEVTHSPDGKERVTGKFQHQIDKLVNNRRAMQHLNRMGRYSGLAMYGMIGKNIVGDVIEGDYQGAAIGVGFIAGAEGLGRLSGLASTKGLQLISKGKLVQGYALRSVAPFLSRVTSLFVVDDLIHQIEDLKAGNKDALVGVIGDSIVLAIDVAAIGIELAEVTGLISGVSSVTGPIALAVGTVIFIGTDIYLAVKTVENIDHIVHLTGSEKFVEGLRAFVGMEPREYIQDLIEKNLNNELVKEHFAFIKQAGIKRYVFPSYERVRHCQPRKFLGFIPAGESCANKPQIALDNSVYLDKKITNITWSKSIPDSPDGGNLFCLPEGKEDGKKVPDSGAYKCVNSIGLDIADDEAKNITMFDLGEGSDYIVGFPDSPNIFMVNNGCKYIDGGKYEDTFVLQGNNIRGIIDGKGGSNTLNFSNFLSNDSICIEFIPSHSIKSGYNSNSISPSSLLPYFLHIKGEEFNLYHNNIWVININKIIGRKNKCDQIGTRCNLEYINMQGGENSIDGMDKINIVNKECSYKTQLDLQPNTEILNSALGNFTYIIQPGNGLTKIDVMDTNSWNNFIFNYSLSDIQRSNIKNNQTNSQLSFNFNKFLTNDIVTTEINVPLENNNIIYHLNDGTEIKRIENILYAYQISNKSTNDIIKDYPSIAERSGMFIVAKSTVSNETITIGNRNEYILNGTTSYTSNVMNNDPSSSNHLVGGKAENVYVITSGYEILENISQLKIPDTTIHEPNESNLTDILDLTYLDRQLSKDLGINLELRLKQDGDDILIQPFIPNHEQQEEQNVTSIRLKDGIKNNWYKRLQVMLNRSRMIIEYNNNNFSLTPLPLAFDKNTSTIIMTPQDVDKNTKLEIPKQAGKYSFYRSEEGLIITNVGTFVEEKNWYTILLTDFYEEDNIQKISIKFNDKEIFLEKEMDAINNAEDFYEFTEKINDENYIFSEVNQLKNQYTIDSNSNVYESPSLTRRRRDTVEYNKNHPKVGNIQEKYIPNSRSTTFYEPRNNLLNSDSIKRIPSIGPDEYGADTGNYNIGNIDFNGGITWLNVLARWFTGYKEKPIKGTSSNLEMNIKAKEIAYRSLSSQLVDLFVKNIKKNLAASGLSGPRFDPDDKVVDQVREKVYTKLLKGETDTISDIQELVKKTIDKIESNSTKKQAKAFLNKITADLPSISNALLKKSELQTGMPNTRLKPDLGLLNQSISSMPSVDHVHDPALLTQNIHNQTYSIASNDTQDVSRYRRSVGM